LVVEGDNMRPNGDPTSDVTDPTPDPTPPTNDATQEALSIPAAAERLGLTSEAIRMRLKRGTLHGEKIDGRWVVYVPRLDSDHTATKPPADGAQDARDGATERPTERDQARINAAERELIEALRSENAFLRSELASRTEEIQRRDHIIAGFIQRLPELPASVGESGTRASPAQDVDATPYAPAPPPAPDLRPWWKRALGIT
jgi:hypothetical protein